MAKAADVLNHFQLDILHKFWIVKWINTAGEDKILPD